MKHATFQPATRRIGLVAAHALVPAFSHSPCQRSWDVMIWGGTNPRNGFDQPAMDFRFSVCGYSLARIKARAEDMAESQHRLFWAVRDGSGQTVARGDCLWARVAA